MNRKIRFDAVEYPELETVRLRLRQPEISGASDYAANALVSEAP
jgi:hypothetical protein